MLWMAGLFLLFLKMGRNTSWEIFQDLWDHFQSAATCYPGAYPILSTLMPIPIEYRPPSKPHLPSGYVKIAIENDHLYWIYPLKMVIFHSYVSLPEGNNHGDDLGSPKKLKKPL